jgi:large subunit ribosomal protein L25
MDVTLTAETGRERGSGPAGRLRAEGKVPGVVYGLGGDAVPVAVEWAELRRALTTDAGVNALIHLDVDGQQNLTLIKDLQRDPLKRTVVHVDFLRVDPDAPIEVEVPIVLVGETTLLDREGGLVEQHMHSLTVSAKPNAIPNEITIDISAITSTDSIKANVIVLPEGVTADVEPDELIAAGFIPRAMVTEEEEAAEGEEGAEGEAAEAGAAAEGDAGGEGDAG